MATALVCVLTIPPRTDPTASNNLPTPNPHPLHFTRETLQRPRLILARPFLKSFGPISYWIGSTFLGWCLWGPFPRPQGNRQYPFTSQCCGSLPSAPLLDPTHRPGPPQVVSSQMLGGWPVLPHTPLADIYDSFLWVICSCAQLSL